MIRIPDTVKREDAKLDLITGAKARRNSASSRLKSLSIETWQVGNDWARDRWELQLAKMQDELAHLAIENQSIKDLEAQ